MCIRDRSDCEGWNIDDEDIKRFAENDWPVFYTSAMNDENVRDVFELLIDIIDAK